MINALAVVQGEDAYSRLIDRTNQLVSESQDVVARRLGRGKKTTEEEETTEL